MGIRSDNLPFKVSFDQYGEKRVKEFNCDDQAAIDGATVVKEYVPLALVFQSDDKDARLYMEGIETLETDRVKEDEQKQLYLSPGTERIDLYRNNDEDYPLIPGYYQIKVVQGENEYTALYHVSPKDMTYDQWKMMRDELEDQLRGLASDFVRNRLSFGLHLDDRYMPPEQFYRFIIIKQYYPKVMLALHDMLTRINFRVKKDYRLLPVDLAKEIDEVTVRYRLQHPENQDSLKTPVREIEYDLPENQWVCAILKLVESYLNEIIESLTESFAYEKSSVYVGRNDGGALNRERRNASSYLAGLIREARRMKDGLQILQTAPWFSQIQSNRRRTVVPPALLYEPRYRTIYQLYRTLKNEEHAVKLDIQHTYQWKRTDLQYEVWGFLKICNTFINDLGYQGVRGWIYDVFEGTTRLFVPTLKSGTTIELCKGDIVVNLIYDKVIPLRSNASKDDVLSMYTDYHNRPDARIDVYFKNSYSGSIVIDFKYRKLRDFWNVHNRYKTATNQLLHYHTNVTSQHYFGGSNLLNPVPEVWAIYPTEEVLDIRDKERDFDEAHKVRFIQACPGKPNEHLPLKLEMGINKLLSIGAELEKMLQFRPV